MGSQFLGSHDIQIYFQVRPPMWVGLGGYPGPGEGKGVEGARLGRAHDELYVR